MLLRAVEGMPIFESYEPIVIEQIQLLEQKIGVPFPQIYRDFLYQNNGGFPEPSGFIYLKNKNSCLGAVNRFLGIHSGKFNNLLKYLDIYKGKEPRIPFDLIPIASDPGGNLICMAILGHNLGKIYFWDHDFEAEWGQQPDYSNVYPIADNLKIFLENLRNFD